MPYQTTIYKINKIPLYSTRNYIQYSVTNHNGKEYENICVCVCVCVCACILHCFSHVWLFATLWTEAHKTPSPMGFSRQNTGVGCHTLLQSIFPSQESKLCLLCLLYWQVGSLPLVPPGSVQFSSVAQACLTLCDPMNRSTPGLTVHHQLLEFTQTHVHRVGDAIQPSHPLSSPSPPAPNPSQHQVLSSESTLCMRWPKYWSFSFSISPSDEHPGLISFRMDWLDLLVVQGTLKSLLQYHSSKTSIFQHSGFFTVQLSHPYMTTGKTIALTRWTFVGKVNVSAF